MLVLSNIIWGVFFYGVLLYFANGLKQVATTHNVTKSILPHVNLSKTTNINNITDTILTNTIYNNPHDVKKSNNTTKHRVIDGHTAAQDQFPGQVSLRILKDEPAAHFCSGTIISDSWVLTAAQCVFNEMDLKYTPEEIGVIAGETNPDDYKDSNHKREVCLIVSHPNYKGDDLGENDLALLRVKNPFILNTPFVKSVPLVKSKIFTGEACQVSGWGSVKDDKTITHRELIYTNVYYNNSSVCQSKIPPELGNFSYSKKFVCTTSHVLNRAICEGDSGGGLVCENHLVGVAFGRSKDWCNREYPDVYTNIEYYSGWIKSTMKDELCAENAAVLIDTSDLYCLLTLSTMIVLYNFSINIIQ